MRVLLAPDKFKGCLTATEVAAALTAGLHDRQPQVEVVEVPVADGGDGTVAAALSAGFTFVDVVTVGPTGAPVETGYAVRGEQAVVELADVVGLSRLPGRRRDPLLASTFGLGVVVRDAIDRGATQIVLGLGGSASTDGGAGLVQALGALLTDGAGRDLRPGGAALSSLDSLDLTALKDRIDGVTFVVACDVDNPLLGPDGAAAVFGPQKGADASQVRLLESALAVWAAVVARTTRVDLATHAGAGAAGGTGFAALALLDATLQPGIDLVLDLVGFEQLVRGVDLVITGEWFPRRAVVGRQGASWSRSGRRTIHAWSRGGCGRWPSGRQRNPAESGRHRACLRAPGPRAGPVEKHRRGSGPAPRHRRHHRGGMVDHRELTRGNRSAV